MLRFFAFAERYKKYEGHLAKFLNSYMHEYQDMSESTREKKRDMFSKTATYITASIFAGKTPPKLSLTVLEGLLVGVGSNIGAIEGDSTKVARQKYEAMIGSEVFSESALREGLSKKPRVIARQGAAISIFK